MINFITKKDYTGGVVTLGADAPTHDGRPLAQSINVGFGAGDLGQRRLERVRRDRPPGTERHRRPERPFNTRYAGGLSPTTSPANYYQDGTSGNPAAPGCTSAPNLIPGAGGTSCQMTTSSFVDYVPKSERTTGLLKGTFRINENHELGLEYMASQSKIGSQIAPVPYGGLIQNRVRPDGSLNPYYPGNPGAIAPNIPLDPAFNDGLGGAGAKPGFIHVKWRDLPNGPRADENINKQQRFIASMTGTVRLGL